ncbi:MAG: DUF2007 domain-containing protein [Chloroflexi bacterium]|nr:DUF2007 domain-containing protein [Chloroflexota bacterium]
MPHSLVTVYTVSGQVEANIIKSMLEAAGIPVMVVQEGAGRAYGLTVGPMGKADILVPEQYAEAARKLLDEMDRGELSGGADDAATPLP